MAVDPGANVGGVDKVTLINESLILHLRALLQQWLRLVSCIGIHTTSQRAAAAILRVYSGVLPHSYGKELEEHLNDSSISQSVHELLLESYKGCWNPAKDHRRRALVKAVSDHINRVLPAPSGPDLVLSDNSAQSHSESATSAFVTLKQGLDFITFLNGRLAGTPLFYRADLG
ncbi:hypothetical protein L218DRAFT_1002386 [Marasmius fiardii PR-910]|nr:hypothetical protein L218DRAFT_1002386 [Marasmius fiardii PR-910]